MAALGRGAVEVVRPDEDTAAAVPRFEARLDRPVLTDLAVDWNGLAVENVTPARLPDLFAGQPLVVSGRLRGPGAATIVITGRRGGETVRMPIAVATGDAARPEIDWLWARARIAELERQELRGERREIDEEITRLALAHKLVTRFTAFVAVDPSHVTAGGPGVTIPVAVNVPDGVDRDRGDRGEGKMGYGGGGASGAGYGAAYGTIGHGSGGGGVSYALKAAEAAPAPIVVATPAPAEQQAKNKLDEDARAALRKCWLAGGGHGAAELHLHVKTGKDGRVATVELGAPGDELGAPGDALAACVTERAKTWSLSPSAVYDFIVAVKESTP
jgi:Ca-activated chloride channel family protein